MNETAEFQNLQKELFGRKWPTLQPAKTVKEELNLFQKIAKKVRTQRLANAARRLKPAFEGVPSAPKPSKAAVAWREKRLENFNPNGTRYMRQTDVIRELQIGASCIKEWRDRGILKSYPSYTNTGVRLYKRRDVLRFVMSRTRLGSLEKAKEYNSKHERDMVLNGQAARPFSRPKTPKKTRF